MNKLIVVGNKDYVFLTCTPEIPAHNPRISTVEAKRQRRSKKRSLAMRQARLLKLAVAQ